ncbi:MAG TPA: EAL domain-containing protein [Nitrosomonas sp.]|nr:EAL domain-containing protein [Nitrosomonas sp.]
MTGKTRKTYIVGIGASAGGLEAISLLVSNLRVDLPCAYVVLQHISPDYKSMMAEILSRETQLKVKELKDGDIPEPGSIFVVPAKSNALIQEGKFHLVDTSPKIVPKPSINQFLISLAAEEGEAAIGIILSGTGSDGVAGLRAIQAAGGFTLVQSPHTAKYDGMPRSAIEANVADHILPPVEIANFLPKLLDIPNLEDHAQHYIDPLKRLLSYLKEQLKIDFTGYKLSTLTRRIHRRQHVTGCLDLSDYLEWIEEHPEELKNLARDMLISVTAFFRDQHVFTVLQQTLQEIIKQKDPGSEIRIWVAGCASGEEAYSIAILFADILGDRLSQYRIQIFATDIDNDAMNIARRGIYPAASMSEIPTDRLDNYFRKIGQTYEVEKILRDMIVFARHNLVSDPPFLRLDLVTCRNVLIYFDATLQKKVLQAFHFGLLPNGYLFLGKSESVTHGDSLFSQINRRERVFQKKGESTSLSTNSLSTNVTSSPVQRKHRRLELLLSALVQHFHLVVALCDRNGDVLHSAGEVNRYLHFPPGTAGSGLAEVVIPELRGEVLTLFRRCQQKHLLQRGRRRRIGKQFLRILINSILDNFGNEFFIFLLTPEIDQSQNEDETPLLEPNLQLESELAITREHLQALIEELATANEEMQALNEEAQASNEELQATNEELEAANEELQASNEELVSLNEELSIRSNELLSISEEYAHLYDSLEFPVLVFDRSFILTRFNTAAERRFNLHLTALQKPFARLELPKGLSNLAHNLGEALDHRTRAHFLTELDNRHFHISVTPGLGKENQVVSLIVSFIDVHDIVSTQLALQESEQRLTALMKNTTIIFAMKDMSGSYTYANRRFIEFFGLQDTEVIGKTDFMLFEHTLASLIWNAGIESVRTKRIITNEYQINREDTHYYLLANHQALFDTSDTPVALIIEAEDISTRKHAEEQLRITARVFDQTAVAIIVTDSKGNIMTVNSTFSQITGFDLNEIINTPIESLVKSGQKRKNFYISISRSLKEKGFWQGELWIKHKHSQESLEWITINRVAGDNPNIDYHVAVISDVSTIRSSQRKAEYLAAHDILTGLPNRILFQDRLTHAIAQARRKRERIALMFIDLDNFKNINDTLGHDVGDTLLKQVAVRLKQITRDVDTVARLGGDEFTAILTDCHSQSAAYVGQRIADELATVFIIQERQLYVSASIGIAFYPEDGDDNSTLIKAADTAMYRAKELGRNRVEFFVPDLHMQLLKRTTLENALRAALSTHSLFLVYQPKFSICAGQKIIGAEALLRWSDSKLGNIPPAEFIPISETSGLILDITKEVPRMLLVQIKKWMELRLNFPPIVFNCSARAMREKDMGEFIIHSLQHAAVPPTLIQVEITECTLLESSPIVISNLSLLHQNGVDISIDDFGTGYSSLAYLKRLPLSELKIDKSFIDGLGNDRDDEAISLAILSLAHALELRTVAEGVETEKQYAWLSKNGCDAVQGYYFSKPLEVNRFENLLFNQCCE